MTLGLSAPVIFVGHGSPENAIAQNRYSREWRALGQSLPRPSAILCVSAHWETLGTRVCASKMPKTIHDFYGFPQELYEVEYPAPGAPSLAERVSRTTGAELDVGWGLDHGCWTVLRNMYPRADIPVAQLSLDRDKSPREHLGMGKSLALLRDEGVLILGSGNIVHNLGLMASRKPYGWASEFDEAVKSRIIDRDIEALADYRRIRGYELAIPTNEHFLPLLYTLGASRPQDNPSFHCEGIELGSIGMRTVVLSGG